jgi:hypothetical protein
VLERVGEGVGVFPTLQKLFREGGVSQWAGGMSHWEGEVSQWAGGVSLYKGRCLSIGASDSL